MATVEMGAHNFEELAKKEGILLVDWWASWCGPCRAFAPVFEQSSNKYPDITFGKIDTDANQELSGAFGIQSIPTLMAFRDGVLLYSQAGALPASALDQLIEKIKELDMNEIRAEIAKRQQQGEQKQE